MPEEVWTERITFNNEDIWQRLKRYRMRGREVPEEVLSGMNVEI